ncbi:hypothetical protein HNP86_001980 [Methanococcus maripaludis]|uniref:Uncharacterized protein n=1 Tax=Methanococcus maripaludis TaxID=39152 RepID=A0A7J9NWZ6_METMI|nr:hypothetical protein [Methanococcus maripaludis]MBA2851821.1 hypothetical protein [Methanococcus maripaludis]
MLLGKRITAGFFLIDDDDVEKVHDQLKKYDFETYLVGIYPYFTTGRKVWFLCNADVSIVEQAVKEIATLFGNINFKIKDYTSTTGAIY